MREIRLKTLTLKNFKCHDHLELDFGGSSARIYGDNGTGKTSIYDGLTWLLFGKDSGGSSAMEVKPLNALGQVRDPLAITEVSACLTVDGEDLQLRRTYHQVFGKERGQQVPEGNTSEYFVDGVPCRRGRYLEKVRQLVEEDTFRMLTRVTRFSQELTAQQRREILFSIAGAMTEEELLSLKPAFRPLLEARGRLTLEELQKKLTNEKRELRQAGTDLPPRISELRGMLERIGGRDYEDLRARRQKLLARRQALDAPDRGSAQALREAGLDLRDLEIKNRAHREKLESALREKRQRLQDLENRLSGLDRDRKDLLALQERIRQEQENRAPVDRCPSCGQVLRGEALKLAQSEFHARQQQAIRQLRERLDPLADRVSRESLLAPALQREKQDLEQALEDPARQPGDLPGFLLKKQELEQRISRLQQEQAPALLQGQALDRELEALDRELGRESLEKNTRQRLDKLISQREQAEKQLQHTEQLLWLLEEFGRFKAEFLEESINSHFRLARFRLFKQLGNGGYEERCDVTLEGIPYGNLNTGSRINVGLDIIRTLSDHYGVRVPLFIDNAESVTRLETLPGQVIRLTVSPGDRSLRLKREEEEECPVDLTGRCM